MLIRFFAFTYYLFLIFVFGFTGYYVFERQESPAWYLLTFLVCYLFKPVRIEENYHLYVGNMENQENKGE